MITFCGKKFGLKFTITRYPKLHELFRPLLNGNLSTNVQDVKES